MENLYRKLAKLEVSKADSFLVNLGTVKRLAKYVLEDAEFILDVINDEQLESEDLSTCVEIGKIAINKLYNANQILRNLESILSECESEF